MRPIVMFLLIASAGRAETESPVIQAPSITVHGEGTATAEPDRAEIGIGVVTQGKTAKAAAEANARQSEAVAQQLKGLVPARQVKTQNFSINPNYDYPKNGSAGVIASFTANNTVSVTVDDLSKLSQVIDATAASGANAINELVFSLKEDRSIRGEALREAAGNAQESAQALAASLNVRLGQVLHVEEGAPPRVPHPVFAAEAMSRSKAVSTPISAGTIEVHVEVTITYAIVK